MKGHFKLEPQSWSGANPKMCFGELNRPKSLGLLGKSFKIPPKKPGFRLVLPPRRGVGEAAPDASRVGRPHPAASGGDPPLKGRESDPTARPRPGAACAAPCARP